LLLAACEWEFLLGLDVRWNLNLNVELASSLAAVCYDLQRDRERPTRKNSKSLWELIIPAFNPASSNSGTIASQGGGSSLKRTAAGALQQGASSSRDSPNANVPMVNRAALSKFCQLLYEPQSLSIILSLFVRLHNVVQDEANLEITADLSSLWPAVLSNANSYYLPGIGEILSQLLERALSLYPLNTAWLKLQGDLHFAQGFHSAAMSCYMTASSLASDYFHQVVPKQVLDEATIRRMIKCSHSASCFTQVLMGSCVIFNDKILIFSLFFQSALLCQLLEEIDGLPVPIHLGRNSAGIHNSTTPQERRNPAKNGGSK
jgi:integrator complex subunit 8